ncbi:MAG TPA: NAD(P)H nitroreductase [Pseudonocardia sp.]|nr:NAD(P)H nitroreductase [Pseudonocardia sp.]
MITETVQGRTLLAALSLAGRAPSVHNSQPWRWRLGDDSVHLYVDPRRWLPATDPHGRDLLLSCGSALHHLRVALAAFDIDAVVHRMPNPAEPDHLAAVELSPGTSTENDLLDATAIERRRSDRRRFSNRPVPPEYLRALATKAGAEGALLLSTDDPIDRSRLITAIETAAAVQDATNGYAVEIGTWSGQQAGNDGVPSANVPKPRPEPNPSMALPMRDFADGELDQPDSGEPDGAVVLALGTACDDRLSQLRAGEAASAVLLTATELGLASSVLSQPLEIPFTRRFVRDRVLGGALCPQLLFRVGWAPAGAAEIPATPRRPVAEVVTRAPA